MKDQSFSEFRDETHEEVARNLGIAREKFNSQTIEEDDMTADHISAGQGRDDADLDRHLIQLLFIAGLAGILMLLAIVAAVVQG